MIALALGSFLLVIWLVLLLARGGFWRVSHLQASAGMKPLNPCRVAAIVPARDEADVIATSFASLITQQFTGELCVIVVDDNSSDGTAEAARLPGVTVVNGAPLPAGWTGKLWALQQGVAAAERLNADYYLFTDADILHDPQNVASLVGIAQARNLDLASHMVKLHCTSLAEKLTMPAFVFFFFKLYPPKWIESSTSRTAGAAGGCVLLKPSALTRIGGLAAIRSEVIDDCSLARAVKHNGGKLWLGLSAATMSIRPYDGLTGIGKMISRSAFRQLNHSTALLIGSVIGLTAAYLLPPVLALTGSYPAMAAWLIMIICYLPMIRFYKLNPLWSLLLPVTAFFYLAATVHSAITFWMGRGGQWKGRAQDLIH